MNRLFDQYYDYVLKSPTFDVSSTQMLTFLSLGLGKSVINLARKDPQDPAHLKVKFADVLYYLTLLSRELRVDKRCFENQLHVGGLQSKIDETVAFDIFFYHAMHLLGDVKESCDRYVRYNRSQKDMQTHLLSTVTALSTLIRTKYPISDVLHCGIHLMNEHVLRRAVPA